MTTTEDIIDLIDTNTDLAQYYQSKRGEIDAAVVDAIRAVPEARKTIYVNALTGDDTASGDTPESAVATIQEAVSRSVEGGFTDVRLMSDYTLDRVIWLNGGSYRVTGRYAAQAPTMTVLAQRVDLPDNIHQPSFYPPLHGQTLLMFDRLNIAAEAAPVPETVVYPVVTFLHGSTDLILQEVNIDLPDASGRMMTRLNNASMGRLRAHLVTATGSMAGKWLLEASAGTDPATIALFDTNLTTL